MISLHITHSSAGIDSMQEIFQTIYHRAEGTLRQTSEDDYVLLKTCNRFEIYLGTDDTRAVRDLERFVSELFPDARDRDAAFILRDEESIRHLFRVSCGLDSLIVGEDQIQGQVREAYVRARSEGHLSPATARIFDGALRVGKRVRSETALNNGAVSVGSAALDLAERRLGTLEGRTVAIIGAGKMATAIAKSLAGRKLDSVFVSNRTYDKAVKLAEMLNGTAVRTEAIVSAITKADLVLVATSAPHIILTEGIVRSSVAGRDSGLLIIDVSVPRNTDEGIRNIPNVWLETMDGLRSVAAENTERRRSEITGAESIVDEEMRRITEEMRERKANEIIGGINRKVAAIREEELAKAVQRASSADVGGVFDDFSRVLVSRILADTYERLKEASRNGNMEICDAAAELFRLEAGQ